VISLFPKTPRIIKTMNVNALYIFMGNAAVALSGFVVIWIMAYRGLLHDLGVYGSYLGLSAMLFSPLSSTIRTSLVSDIISTDNIRAIMSAVVIYSAATLGALLAYGFLLDESSNGLLLIVFSTRVIEVLSQISYGIRQKGNDHLGTFTSQTAKSILGVVAFTIYSLRFPNDNITYALSAQLATSLVVFIFADATILTRAIPNSGDLAFNSLKGSLSLGGASALVSVRQQLPRMLLPIISSPEVLGRYMAIAVLVQPVTMLGGAIFQSKFRGFVKYCDSQTPNTLFAKADYELTRVFPILLGMLIVVYFWGEMIVNTAYPASRFDEYHVFILGALLTAAFLETSGAMWLYMPAILKRPSTSLRLSAWTTVIAVLVCACLAAWIGEIGMAIGVAIGSAVHLLAHKIFTPKYI